MQFDALPGEVINGKLDGEFVVDVFRLALVRPPT